MPATIYVVLASFAGLSGRDQTPYLIECGSRLRVVAEEPDGLFRVEVTTDDFQTVHRVSVLSSDLRRNAIAFLA